MSEQVGQRDLRYAANVLAYPDYNNVYSVTMAYIVLYESALHMLKVRSNDPGAVGDSLVYEALNALKREDSSAALAWFRAISDDDLAKLCYKLRKYRNGLAHPAITLAGTYTEMCNDSMKISRLGDLLYRLCFRLVKLSDNDASAARTTNFL